MADTIVHEAIHYAQAVHCQQAHGARLQVDVRCATCLALHSAVQTAAPQRASTSRGTGSGRSRREA